MKKKIWKKVFLRMLVLGTLGMMVGCGVREQQSGHQNLQKIMRQVEKKEIDSIFLSMYPVDTYDEKLLYDYKLAKTEILQAPLESGEQLAGVLEEILSESNALKNVFLGLYDESIIIEESTSGNKDYESNLIKQGFTWEEAILELGKAHPEITFEIMLYYPKISYWTALDEQKVQEKLDWYAYAGDLYSHYDVIENVHVFMPGCEEWLICNESNYKDDYSVTDFVAVELEKLVLCDYKTIMIPNSIEEQCGKLEALIEKYRGEQPEYGMYSDYTYVFLGDSVIGNYEGSLSIPGVVSYMTGADAINCGYGGLPASKEDEQSIGLDGVLDALLSDKKSSMLKALENENVQAGIKAFWEKNISVDEEKLIFFISFGINDYAVGRPVYNDSMDEYCYVGALKNGIDRLQEAYPKSKIVLMTPNYVEIFEHGTLDNSGKGFVFTDFVEAAKELAEQEQLQLVDVFGKLGITAENTSAYLADGCHPSYYGRYKIGELIWKSLMLQ